MLVPYLICLLTGGGILAFSIFAGGGDADVDGDVDADIDAGVDADVGGDVDADVDADVGISEGLSDGVDGTVSAGDAAMAAMAEKDRRGLAVRRWRPLKELRFWTFSAAFFGLAGTLFHFIGVFALEPLEAVISAAMGVGCGTLASYVFHAMTIRQVSSMAEVTDYEGQIGKVLLPVVAGESGKVRLVIRGQISDFQAITFDEKPIERGGQVLVTKYEADKGQLRVTRYQAAAIEDKKLSV